MKILVTGSAGFVGKNLVEALKNIRDGKDRTHPSIKVDEIFCYDVDSTKEELEEYCTKADFVFNLVGVNRPLDSEEFMRGNCFLGGGITGYAEKARKEMSVMISSSI